MCRALVVCCVFVPYYFPFYEFEFSETELNKTRREDNSQPTTNTHTHIYLSVSVPGPRTGVWRGLTGLSSVHSSAADDGSGPWSPLHGPDGVSPDTEKERTLTYLLCTAVPLSF